MRVLIVDDSTVVRERVVAMLSDLQPGLEVVGQAGEVDEAILATRRLKPDAVILDISMPGKSGIEALRAITQDSPAPLVMMLTNYPYAQYRKRCLDAGADFFYDKSTEFCKVAETFRRLTQDPLWDRRRDICEGCSQAAFECSQPRRRMPLQNPADPQDEAWQGCA
jgi:DNA-binding NarL/FixJ family response regulator